MSRLRVRGRQLIQALQKAGFEVIRTKGSHHFMRHPDGRVTVVPVHSGETIGPGLLNQILKDTKINQRRVMLAAVDKTK
jgi:predicted RNA binding protein YcfA (HicA-like mRNA interferase family)